MTREQADLLTEAVTSGNWERASQYTGEIPGDVCNFTADDGTEVLLVAQSDTGPSVWTTADDEGELLVANVFNSNVPSQERLEAAGFLDAGFGDQYAQGIALQIPD